VNLPKIHEKLEYFWVGVGAGDNLQKGEIARRIEKVGARKMPTKIFRASFGQKPHGYPRSVAGDEGGGTAVFFYFFIEGALYGEVFYDYFYNPVGFGNLGKVIGKVT
jgi:hypothetical protein